MCISHIISPKKNCLGNHHRLAKRFSSESNRSPDSSPFSLCDLSLVLRIGDDFYCQMVKCPLHDLISPPSHYY
ncbi:hypothetical protein Pfo_017663 [Paulownia fortunei]|nr:hypothetical protein Pfo_017663 [Paulownia fortunei]